jgi:rhodanese-related sulfurtransferase
MKKLTTIPVLLAAVVLLEALAGRAAQQEPKAGPAPAQSAVQPAGRAQGQDQAQAAAVKKLTRAEFDALLKDPSRVIVLDVRRPDELQSIGGFPVYLSIQAAEVEKYLAFIPKDRSIVAVSNHANRAQRAAALLEKNGFKVAGAIGVQDYEGEGGTLVKIAAPAPRTAAAPAGGTPPAAPVPAR